MSKIIKIGKKKINELLKLPQFEGHQERWAYSALNYTNDSADANAFREYVLSHCSGYLVTKKPFKN